jgi:succinate dehydrogenase/fumarate reductase flavoprotein subunit
MDFSKWLEKLQKAKDWITDAAPNALERIADVLHEIEEVAREGAQFLRNLSDDDETIKATRKGAKGLGKKSLVGKITAEEKQQLVNLDKEFGDLSRRTPGIVNARRATGTKKQTNNIDPKVEVALCTLCYGVTQELLKAVEE